MSYRKSSGLALCVLAPMVFASGTALAAAKQVPSFKTLDTNHDGYIEANEARQAPTVARNFQLLDANGDGRISRDEYQALVNAMRDQSRPSHSS